MRHNPPFGVFGPVLPILLKPWKGSGTSHISYPIWRPPPFVRSFNPLKSSDQNKAQMAKMNPDPSGHKILAYFSIQY